MKKSAMMVLVLTVFCCVGAALAGDCGSWCEHRFCKIGKPFKNNKALLPNMTQELTEIENGIMLETTVKPESMMAYRAAVKIATDFQTVKDALAADPPDSTLFKKLCPGCQLLMTFGADIEVIETEHGNQTLFTSDDPMTVANLQLFMSGVSSGEVVPLDYVGWFEKLKEKKEKKVSEPRPDGLPTIDEFVPVEQTAEMTHYQPPDYPREANQAEIEGTVWIKALVSNKGTVLDAVIYKSSGTESLDKAALEAAYGNKFKPAVQKGQPVAMWVVWKVKFEF